MARSAKNALKAKGWTASRDKGNVSALEHYRQMRSYGATAEQAYGVAKSYKQMTTGDYY